MIARFALLETGVATRARCTWLQRGFCFVALCLILGNPTTAAHPSRWIAQPRAERTVLFGGGTSKVEIIFRNQSDAPSSVRVGCRWLRVAGSIAAPLPNKDTWWTIRGEAGAALLETIPLAVPSVETPAPHLLQWFDESGHVLGTIPVAVLPTTLFSGLDSHAPTNSEATTPATHSPTEGPHSGGHRLNRFRFVTPGASKAEMESARTYASTGGIVLELAGATIPACWIQTLQCGLWVFIPISKPEQLAQDPLLQLVLMEAIDTWNRRLRPHECATLW